MAEQQSTRQRLSVTWIAKAGFELQVKQILFRLAEATRKEPGCVSYIVYQATDDPRHFLLYEEYRDADALRVHSESLHFKRYVQGEAAPVLELRQRVQLRILDGVR